MAVITASPSNFMKLLDLQQKSLENLTSIKTIIETSQAVKAAEMSDIRQVAKEETTGDKYLKKIDQTLAKGFRELTDAQIKQIENVAEQATSTLSLGDKLEKLKESFTKYSPKNIKQAYESGDILTGFMKKLNVGGILNKNIAEREFVSQQKALGSEKSKEELQQDFKERRKSSKDLQKQDEEIAKFKKKYNVTDEQFENSSKGKEMLSRRTELLNAVAKTDIRTSEFSSNVAPPAQDALATQEDKEETIAKQEEQTNILKSIAENTSPEKIAKSNADAGSGMMTGIGEGLKALGGGFEVFGKGAGAGIRGFLIGMAQGLAALANPATLLGLGGLTVSMMGLGKALEMAAPAIEAFAPVLMKVAEVVGDVFMKAIEKLPEALKAVGGVITAVGGGIATVITAIADSIVKVVDAVRRLFGIGSDTNAAENAKANVTSNVGAAVKNMARGATNGREEKYPANWDEATKVEYRNMQIEKDQLRREARVQKIRNGQGVDIDRASAENAQAALEGRSIGGAGTNIVNAPVQNVSKQQTVVQLPIRNNEQSMNRYLGSRFDW